MKHPAVVDLKKALYLNSAAALLKQAESVHGAPALKPRKVLCLRACSAMDAPHLSVYH